MKTGRPPRFKTPQEMQEVIDKYFRLNEKTTTEGLAKFMGFTTHTGLCRYKKKDKFKQILHEAISNAKRLNRNIGIKFKTHKQYNRDLYQKDPRTNIITRTNAHIRFHFNRHGIKNIPSFKDLPYTPEEMLNNLECKFKKGMTWHNMSDWHIDHIVPASKFTFTSSTCLEFIQCYSLQNIEPVWAKDNLRKQDTIIEDRNQISIGL